MNKRIKEIEELSREMGLDAFPVVYEIIERSTMFNICAYGLPTRARHWSYGRSYDHLKTHGQMGLSKIYEVILNNNPCYAFMLDTNTEVQNLFIAAHCQGHSYVYKQNYLFKKTNRNMIKHAAEHAGRIDEYIEQYGFEKVEHLMDIGFSLSRHIDWHKGLYRKPYGSEKIIQNKNKIVREFDDILPKRKQEVKKVSKKHPPYPEKDLLWFFINYAPLEDWEKDVLDIIREEQFYFYPQMLTKIVHEGFSSYWHAEVMYNYKGLTQSEYVDFLRTHEKVVQPGGNPFSINPYYLGYKIFKDIEKRWDDGKGEGRKKVLEVAAEEDDISFIRNYLTADLVEELKLFTYGYSNTKGKKGERFIEIKERMRDYVVETLVAPLYNGGVPKISIVEIGPEGKLIMKHDSSNVGTLDHRFASKTLEYIWDLWAAPIEIHTNNDDGEDIVLCFDEAGYYEKMLNEELYEEEEEEKPYQGRIILP